MITGIIYRAYDQTGTLYLGSTKSDWAAREANHYADCFTHEKPYPFYRYWRKVGRDKVKFETLVIMPFSCEDQMHVMEQYFIDFHRSTCNTLLNTRNAVAKDRMPTFKKNSAETALLAVLGTCIKQISRITVNEQDLPTARRSPGAGQDQEAH
jgi:hypothetical protein